MSWLFTTLCCLCTVVYRRACAGTAIIVFCLVVLVAAATVGGLSSSGGWTSRDSCESQREIQYSCVANSIDGIQKPHQGRTSPLRCHSQMHAIMRLQQVTGAI